MTNPVEIPRIISVDDHVVEPPELWTERLPAKYRDRGPRVVREKTKFDFARVPTRLAVAAVTALKREALLADAVPVLANLDELTGRLQPGDEIALAIAAALDAHDGPLVITTSTPGLETHAAQRSVAPARSPICSRRSR